MRKYLQIVEADEPLWLQELAAKDRTNQLPSSVIEDPRHRTYPSAGTVHSAAHQHQILPGAQSEYHTTEAC
jgi:hypothetical protein